MSMEDEERRPGPGRPTQSLAEVAKELGVAPSLIRQIAPGAQVKASAIEVNRLAFARACEMDGIDPTTAWRQVLRMLSAKRAGRVVVPVVKEIKEIRHRRVDGELVSDGCKDTRLIESGITVPAMVEDTRTQLAAAALFVKLIGLDPGQTIKMEGGPGSTTNNTLNVMTQNIVMAAEEAAASGDYTTVRALYQQRMAEVASGAAGLLDAQETTDEPSTTLEGEFTDATD